MKPDNKYNFYLGNLHSHSVYSGDCAKDVAEKFNNGIAVYEMWTPEDVYELAKKSGYDFYAVTDHSSPEFNEFYRNGFTEEHWENTKRFAESCTEEHFLALYGFEFSRNIDPDNGGLGHMGVYNTVGFQSGYAPGNTFEALYNWLTSLKEEPVVAQFNHPAMPGNPEMKNFKDFQGRTKGRNRIITLAEMWNGKPEDISYQEAVKTIWRLGWKVGPTAGSDIHGLEGIPENRLRTGVLATSLNKAAVLDALKNRRVYATIEPKLQLAFWVNDSIMGTAFERKPERDLTIRLFLNLPGAESALKAEIYGANYAKNGGATEMLSTVNVEEPCEHKVSVPNIYDFYYMAVFHEKSEFPFAYSSPVWMDNE